jgi:hypothetical protein
MSCGATVKIKLGAHATAEVTCGIDGEHELHEVVDKCPIVAGKNDVPVEPRRVATVVYVWRSA